jgi:hypothetical protein
VDPRVFVAIAVVLAVVSLFRDVSASETGVPHLFILGFAFRIGGGS